MTPRFTVLTIDPGYATAGIVALRAGGGLPFELLCCEAWKINRDEDTHVLDHLDEVADMFMSSFDEFEPDVFVYEEFFPGMNKTVARLRCILDGMVLRETHDRCFRFIAPPLLHKRLLHPDGKAMDKGRKTDVQYNAHLFALDNLLSPEYINRIADPVIMGHNCEPKKWKDGKQHVLDAASMGLAAALGLMVCTASYGFRDHPYLTVTPAQTDVALQVAEWMGRV